MNDSSSLIQDKEKFKEGTTFNTTKPKENESSSDTKLRTPSV